MPRSLTERQRRFVEAYLLSRNAKQAALDAPRERLMRIVQAGGEKVGKWRSAISYQRSAIRRRPTPPILSLSEAKSPSSSARDAGLVLHQFKTACAFRLRASCSAQGEANF
jgi:hypothetical protein